MDMINAEGVSTDTIKRKSRRLCDLESRISTANNQIENLKEWIGDIKAKRIAVEAALDQQIHSKQKTLEKRLRRQRQLKRELDLLLVRIVCFANVCENSLFCNCWTSELHLF
jgi:chromosome segregation ATPase